MASFVPKRKHDSAEYSDEETQETLTSWRKAFKSFSCQRRLNLPQKRTLMIHWKDFTEGFIIRESEEVIRRACEGQGRLCYMYSGDMFDDWIYFTPVEMKDKDWYCKYEDRIEVTDENILSEIHHLVMAYKAAQSEDYPESHTRNLNVNYELGHSGIEADDLMVQPSQLTFLYWEARAQGFHDLRGKLFTVEFLRLLFKGIENLNITYSTDGSDSYLDRWGYIQEGPTERLSGHCDLGCDKLLNACLHVTLKDRYKVMLKYLDYVSFDLKKDSQKATPDVSVSIGNDLVLVALIANTSDNEHKKIQHLHPQMLFSLDKHNTLFGMLVQGHQIHLAEYTYEQTLGYKRTFSRKAFKFQEGDLKLLYLYLHMHVDSKK